MREKREAMLHHRREQGDHPCLPKMTAGQTKKPAKATKAKKAVKE